jgi:alginate O-acetyltransferase complex protein AlgI
MGLAKKVLIADTFGIAVNSGYANIAALNSTNAIIIMLAYTFQIYFDFSGYSDMAIGLAKMFNIDLPLNFNSPYKSLTIKEFWDRWHMTLTRFFTKYIYIPLGGSRKGNVKTYVNIMIVFIVSGFWHGANWTFVLWGFLHGVFSVITRRFKNMFGKLHPALNYFITFGFINFTWIIFRANSIRDAARIIYRILKCNFGPISAEIANAFRLPELNLLFSYFRINKYFPYALFWLFFVGAFVVVLGSSNVSEKAKKFNPTVLNIVKVVILLVWSIISLTGISTFLYFNF